VFLRRGQSKLLRPLFVRDGVLPKKLDGDALRPASQDPYPTNLARVVRKAHNAIRRINHYPADSVACFVNNYPLDSDLSGG